MIQVTKEERAAIAREFPDVHVVRTMKGDSKRHHYYCEEAPRVLRFLERMRSRGVIYENGIQRKGGGRHK